MKGTVRGLGEMRLGMCKKEVDRAVCRRVCSARPTVCGVWHVCRRCVYESALSQSPTHRVNVCRITLEEQL